MYAQGSKKMLILYVLEVLKNYSDENHRLTQQEIINFIERDYGMECERKAVSRNITALQEFEIDIENDGGYYLASRQFEDAELRLLIDSLLSSKHIPTAQCRQLIEKLKGLANKYFSAKVRHISNLSELGHTDNKQLFYTIDILDEAIEQEKKVSFYYNEYGSDKKFHQKKDERYIVNPYQIVVTNGRYYLIGNYNKYDNVAHYRLDKITDIELLDDSVKPMKSVKGLENGLNLPKHLAEHIYMFCGASVFVTMQIDNKIIGDVIDWFGRDFTILIDDEKTATIRLKVNENAMYYWALQYGAYVEILEPKTLRDEIKETIINIAKKYEG